MIAQNIVAPKKRINTKSRQQVVSMKIMNTIQVIHILVVIVVRSNLNIAMKKLVSTKKVKLIQK